MPRKPRYYLTGVPCHVIQRGHNRNRVSLRQTISAITCSVCAKLVSSKATVHAHVLMTNHVHLLATPAETDGISRMLQTVGRRLSLPAAGQQDAG